MSQVQTPAWLTAAVDQRMALLRTHVTEEVMSQGDIIFMPLTEPPEGSSKEQFQDWDKTCDHCNKVVTGLYTGHVSYAWRGKQVLIFFGVCETCKVAMSDG